jgi:hypothetical protein
MVLVGVQQTDAFTPETSHAALIACSSCSRVIGSSKSGQQSSPFVSA